MYPGAYPPDGHSLSSLGIVIAGLVEYTRLCMTGRYKNERFLCGKERS
jgi:hypothetical protein